MKEWKSAYQPYRVITKELGTIIDMNLLAAGAVEKLFIDASASARDCQ